MRKGDLQIVRKSQKYLAGKLLLGNSETTAYRVSIEQSLFLTTFLETSSKSSFGTFPLPPILVPPRGHRCFWTGLLQPHLSCPPLTGTHRNGQFGSVCMCKQDRPVCIVLWFALFASCLLGGSVGLPHPFPLLQNIPAAGVTHSLTDGHIG